MSPFRYRDEESGAASALYVALGALAGFAAGVVVAQQYGGISGITARIRDRIGNARNGEEDVESRVGGTAYDHGDDDESDDYYDDDESDQPLDESEELEERVLEAFRNDPVLSERAIDIGAIDDGIVELTGWVNADDESQPAVVIARGVPGVETVVNRLAVRAEEDLYDELADRYDDGDPSLTEGQWEGQSVGTGRTRQGNSADIGRHEDPRTELEEKILDKPFLDPEDEAEIKAERRSRPKKSGVPRGDHVPAQRLNGKGEQPQSD